MMFVTVEGKRSFSGNVCVAARRVRALRVVARRQMNGAVSERLAGMFLVDALLWLSTAPDACHAVGRGNELVINN